MSSLIVQCVVGTPEEIRSGRGETAVSATQAAARLNVSVSTFRNMVKAGELAPCARYDKTQLFLERDVERLRSERMTE